MAFVRWLWRLIFWNKKQATSRIIPAHPQEIDAKRLAAAFIAIEALSFYADPETYFGVAVIGDKPHGDFVGDASSLTEEEKDIWVDYRGGQSYHGKRAREALAAWRAANG